MKIFKKLFSLFVCVLIICGLLIPTTFAENYASSFSSKAKKSTIEILDEGRIQLQFNATKPFYLIGIPAGVPSKGKTLEVNLYKWVSNVRDSREGTVIASKNYSAFERYQLISIDGDFEAGEYLFEILVHGDGMKFNWYSIANTGFKGYQDDYDYDGTPAAELYFKDNTTNGLKEVTKSTELPKKTAPAESTISPDSTIAKLNVDSTQWSFVDGLGRSSVTYEEAGDKNNKKVGIFYWTWHNNFAGNKPINVNAILTEYPEAVNDYNHKIWKSNQAGAYFWNEPLYGYYTEMDDYVLRNHAELLADAGIDFVLFDATNGNYTWEAEYLNLLKVWAQAREEGVKTPQIAFMLPFGSGGSSSANNADDLQQIYKAIYKNNKYQDLWFYLDGKPMVMGTASGLDLNDPFQAEIANFFTFREGQPSYWLGDMSNDYWGWLHVYPQALYKRADGSVEMTTVGVAMNANYKTRQLDAMNSGFNMGRGYSEQKDFSYSFTYRGETITCNSSMENAYYYGINFQEQWDYAISQNPDIVFVTGWNEWIAGRNDEWCGTKNAFPDQCDDENSRDIEPSTGELKDYYYYQLVNNVRRFKGMSEPVKQETGKAIDINGDVTQWDDESIISFNNYYNNRYERNNVKGWSGKKYTNDQTRNDIITAKVTYDEENIYFYVETANDITPYTDTNWMRLLLDTAVATADSKDWENFEYIIGRETGTTDTLALERSTGGWNWEKVCDVKYSVKGNVMQIEISRESLKLAELDKEISFNFKWADCNLSDGDIMTLYTDGDSAPVGRFTFSFNATGSINLETENPDEPEPQIKKGCGSVIVSSSLCALMCVAFVILRKK